MADSSLGAVFWFSGGPGQTNLSYNPPAELTSFYDVVEVGYRGVDGKIKLNCEEMEKALKGVGKNLLSQKSQKGLLEAAQQCAIRLKASGIDLDGFTIEQTIKDMEAAREALGYEKINLLAGSYGTRVSQIYMQEHPSVISRAILVGTGVPGGFVWTEAEFKKQLDELNILCQADPYCSQKTSDLAGTMNTVLDNAPGHWLLLGIDVGKVRTATFGMLYHVETAQQVVDAYLMAADGDYSGIALISLAYNFTFPKMMVWGDFLAKGLIDYNPDVDYFNEMEEEKKTALGSPLSALIMDTGKEWPTKQPDFNEDRVIQTPVLLLNGTLDFSTPTHNIEEKLMPKLPNGQLVKFRGLGHVADILYRKDVKQSMPQFYRGEFTGLRPEPSVFNFNIRNGLPKMAKIGLGIVLVLIICIAFGSYRLLRYLRR
ncbi:MAG: alpha/beta hydrolase [Roseivirga sp.]|nr:alpha/beta hydrolase [Roseivirga sp.]